MMKLQNFMMIHEWNNKCAEKQQNHSIIVAQEGDNICSCCHYERGLNFKVRYTEKLDRMKKPA